MNKGQTMERHKPLSAAFVQKVSRPGRYGDRRGGYGLSLLVKPSPTGRVSKSWSQQIRIGDKLVSIGLGAWPFVSLADAREKAGGNRWAVEEGRDPRRAVAAACPTFAEAAERVIALHASTWRNDKTESQWRASLESYVFPIIGGKAVGDIATADIMTVLEPIWGRETGRRLRQRLGAIFQWAIAQNLRSDNPVSAVDAAMPKASQQVTHHRALPHADVAAALARVRQSGAFISTKTCLELVALTAVRSGEARGATWGEINLEAAIWTIPGARMKTGREHRVPLSDAALAVLEQAAGLRDDSGDAALVFPSARGKVLSDNTLSKLLRELGVDAVVHGFRSSFRDWAAETGQPRDVAEASLAHDSARNAVEAAYLRTDLLARRRELMAAWADYLAA